MSIANETSTPSHDDSGLAFKTEEDSVLSLLVQPNPKLRFCINDFTQQYAKHFGYYLPGTRISHLKAITDWINSPELQRDQNFETKHHRSKSNRTVFWVTGDAGTGKIIITSKLIQVEHDNSLIGWHFCNHSNILQNSSPSIIQSVSGMMSAKLPEYKAAISDLDESELEKATAKGDSMKVFELLFIIPFNKMDPPRDINGKICPKLIVIDALDEINEKYLEEFLRILRDGWSELPPW
eukprot:CAMPEP_0171323048 /NCGR_PEP_ID=MMETSP0816-20121228/115330_1 /TAXON_ID=420281 /ORGANISM="Proboscia inermis, Strain CCAP1064/1" /LENGTH=237 /DNA_ID=CAMNT_0011821657 /DNA_START=535 /DNA_END=1245 /DNA_ORIENTATION=+